MTNIAHHAQNAKHHAHAAIHAASPWIVYLARAGYAAKGIVYCVVGVLALMAAFNAGGQTTGSRGALQAIADQPFGQVLLGVVAVGLAGYALWCFVRAVMDPEDHGSDAKGLAVRAMHFGKGLIHVGLVIAAVGMLTGSAMGNGGGGNSQEGWTARLMSYPAGMWMVGAIGAGIAIYGLYQIYKAWKVDLDDELALSQMSESTRKATIWFGRLGMAARGVVFTIIGGFLILAAWQHDPQEAGGVGDALAALQRQPFGPWLLGAVAVGLIAYGLYEFVRAKYRRVETD